MSNAVSSSNHKAGNPMRSGLLKRLALIVVVGSLAGGTAVTYAAATTTSTPSSAALSDTTPSAATTPSTAQPAPNGHMHSGKCPGM
jgi:hypothetical protein